VRFKGIVHFEGTVQLDSCFEGEIHTNGILVVGEHAVIRGTLTVGTLISSEQIQGDVTASEKVQLLKTAVQIGDVHSPVFSIEEGAYFKGFSDIGAGPWVEDSSTDMDPLPDQAVSLFPWKFKRRILPASPQPALERAETKATVLNVKCLERRETMVSDV
jgi:cytoskeletal protein CcmA (bactofilin family)